MVEGPFSPTDIGELPVANAQQLTAQQLAVNILNVFLQLADVAALFFLIYYSILIITSAGEEQKVEQGKKGIIWTVAGIIVITLSLYLISATQNAVTVGGAI